MIHIHLTSAATSANFHHRRCGIVDFPGMRLDRPLQRILAILLLVLIGFPPLTPAFGSDSESNLPACCRRTGAHHCSLQSSTPTVPAPPSAPVVRGNPRCPLYPGIVSSTGALSDAKVPPAFAIKRPTFERETAFQHCGAILAISQTTAHPKRDPPSSARAI